MGIQRLSDFKGKKYTTGMKNYLINLKFGFFKSFKSLFNDVDFAKI